MVAAGGDGTIRAAASALIGSAVPLGVIALGTANVLASEVNLPRAPDPIARMLMHGPTTTMSCGSVDGEPFLLMAGAGFDASVVSVSIRPSSASSASSPMPVQFWPSWRAGPAPSRL